MQYRIGIDEVGRGPIAGPVVVCVCAVEKDLDLLYLFPKGELRDSKKLSEKKRGEIISALDSLEKEKKLQWRIGEVSAERIDEIGIVPSLKEAMDQALISLESAGISLDTEVLLDGSLYAPKRYEKQSTHIKGDEKFIEISLASIIAKVYRDRLMKEIGKELPLYGFENHVGYGTKAHYFAIEQYGFTKYHRKSFLKRLI